jgi:xeroderma pigmentosum group C-complementing protein
VDYADAVTGFDFSGRRASARINGVVVSSEAVEGLVCVWEGMMERVEGEGERRRVAGVVERWRRFLVRMGIRARLEEMHGKVEEMSSGEEMREDDVVRGRRGAAQSGLRDVRGDVESSDDDHGGGFVLQNEIDDEGECVPEDDGEDSEDGRGGFIYEEDDGIL